MKLNRIFFFSFLFFHCQDYGWRLGYVKYNTDVLDNIKLFILLVDILSVAHSYDKGIFHSQFNAWHLTRYNFFLFIAFEEAIFRFQFQFGELFFSSCRFVKIDARDVLIKCFFYNSLKKQMARHKSLMLSKEACVTKWNHEIYIMSSFFPQPWKFKHTHVDMTCIF